MCIYRLLSLTSLVSALFLSQILVYSSCLADETLPIQWNSLKTRYTIIHFQSLDQLQEFNHRIRYGPWAHGLLSLFMRRDTKDLSQKVTEKIDAMFERIQEILDMRKAMDRVKINLYGNIDQLHQAYSSLYGAPCRIRAWYEYTNNTIYINIKDLHEGILAHELAHSIIDNYLVVRPPRATAEILARYVDLHLTE